MRFDTSQSMKLGQQMKLAPRMIQSMEILQMPLLQLEERIEQELQSNALLELAEPSTDPLDARPDGPAPDSPDAERPLNIDDGSGADDFERLDSFEAANADAVDNQYSAADARPDESFREAPLSRARLDGEPDAKSEAMANTAARSASMTEQLLDQWRVADVDETLRPIGEQIIAFIEEDGYLRTPLQTILDRSPNPVPVAQAERALLAVQLLLEPPGIAARDVRECLVLQADALADEAPPAQRPVWSDVRTLIADHLDDLAQNRLPKVAEKTGFDMDRLKRALDQMRALSLAPGRRLKSEPAGAIIPDAIIEFDEDQNRYIAYLNESRLPNLRVNQEYARMARDRQVPKPDRDFLKKSLTNAAWLMDAVEQRKKTLLRVINVVIDAQRDFFDFGPQALKPLPMTQVADQLGIHVATVSRAVADKHLLTPRGIVPLRAFFTGGTQTDSGEDVSWDAVKAALKEVIDAEDKHAPLSDEALADEIKKRGIEIARRTVAKYRDQLGIPPARLRKTY